MEGSARQCGLCAYDLTGVKGNRCPECGKQTIDLEARAAAARSLDEFVDGSIDGGAVFATWSSPTADPTLHRARAELGQVFEQFIDARFGDHCRNARQLRDAMKRWAVFLRSGREHPGARPAPSDPRLANAFAIVQCALILLLLAGFGARGSPLFSVALLLLIGSLLLPYPVRAITGMGAGRTPATPSAARRGSIPIATPSPRAESTKRL